ncbi:hypothetical protein GALL_431470 [mine drainage metagenome]|uniref:Uncharacterized protein n=1 Tax=mine drainage metagenome TaxID=410659 RepID=A0A1J5PU99_9ZZZZ
MEELGVACDFGNRRALRLEPVFHRLHVMVRGALDRLDLAGLRGAETEDQTLQGMARVW